MGLINLHVANLLIYDRYNIRIYLFTFALLYKLITYKLEYVN